MSQEVSGFKSSSCSFKRHLCFYSSSLMECPGVLGTEESVCDMMRDLWSRDYRPTACRESQGPVPRGCVMEEPRAGLAAPGAFPVLVTHSLTFLATSWAGRGRGKSPGTAPCPGHRAAGEGFHRDAFCWEQLWPIFTLSGS